MKRFLFCVISSIFLFFYTNLFAWDCSGHKLVAAVAYHYLTPQARAQVNRLGKVFGNVYPGEDNFLAMACFPDKIKGEGVQAFNNWHFINISYNVDGIKGPAKPQQQNVVWAINQAESTLNSPQANQFSKALFLSFLIHFVGDVHQPMHCIERYSKQTPNGDQGGNLFPIKNKYVNELHAYWDKGLGAFAKPFHQYPLNNAQVEQLAIQIIKQEPEASLQKQVNDLQPYDWARESYNIGKDFAYDTPWGGRPSWNYVKQGRQIVMRRIALAGYRLAKILNGVFDNMGNVST